MPLHTSSAVLEGNAWKKLAKVSVDRGGTAYPKSPADLERLGVRLDYDGQVQRPDGVYNKFQMQPNAGKIPASIERWKNENGGTHAVMASVYVKDGGSKEDVENGLREGIESVKG